MAASMASILCLDSKLGTANSHFPLPPTIVYGAYPQKVYDQITPTKIALNETVTRAADCATLVHRDHREATGVEYTTVCVSYF